MKTKILTNLGGPNSSRKLAYAKKNSGCFLFFVVCFFFKKQDLGHTTHCSRLLVFKIFSVHVSEGKHQGPEDYPPNVFWVAISCLCSLHACVPLPPWLWGRCLPGPMSLFLVPHLSAWWGVVVMSHTATHRATPCTVPPWWAKPLAMSLSRAHQHFPYSCLQQAAKQPRESTSKKGSQAGARIAETGW